MMTMMDAGIDRSAFIEAEGNGTLCMRCTISSNLSSIQIYSMVYSSYA